MQKELHLFIIWEKGLFLADPICNDLATRFKILQKFKVTWNKNGFGRKLAEFYGKSLPKGCKKERECGCGSFLAIVVEDTHPVYQNDKNINLTSAKQMYRRWFEKRNFIHCSDTRAEGIDNIRYILGLTPAEVYASAKRNPAEKIIEIKEAEPEKPKVILWLQNFNTFGKRLRQTLNLW